VSDAFYTRLAETASRLLGRFGATVTACRQINCNNDPVTGQQSSGYTQTLKAKGIIQTFKDATAADQAGGRVADSRILASDRLLILDNSFEPLVTDTFEIGGQNWNAVSVMSAQPANVGIVYFVQVRR